MRDEKVFYIDIRLSRGWGAVLGCLLAVAVLFAVGLLQQNQVSALTSETAAASSSGMRQFYLTSSASAYGSIAASQCASGYHMASLWEMADPSNLKYNTSLGYMRGDSGWGPPAGEGDLFGWVRTGYTNNTSTTPGRANCSSYTSHSFGQYGTIAALPSQWTSGVQDIGPWDTLVRECDDWMRVWCVED
jgi:hypothetical protein